MRNRRLDNNHDWTFGQGRNNYCNASEAIAQRVKCRLWSFVNDWFLDVDFGLPWIEKLETRNGVNEIVLMVKNQVLNTDGVVEVSECTPSFNSETRKLTISVSYIDQYGNQGIATTNQG